MGVLKVIIFSLLSELKGFQLSGHGLNFLFLRSSLISDSGTHSMCVCSSFRSMFVRANLLFLSQVYSTAAERLEELISSSFFLQMHAFYPSYKY